MSTFANSEDPDEMQRFIGPPLEVKKIFRQNNKIFFENYKCDTSRHGLPRLL